MEDLAARALEADPEYRGLAAAFVGSGPARAPDFWLPEHGRTIYVPVPGAEIRVIHVQPERAYARRPVVLVPGWGTIPEGFREFYGPLHGKAEFWYIETREKTSSRILDRKADLSVGRAALDIRAALDATGLAGQDFVLVGSCWGSAQILEGLIRGALDAPTLLLADPMHSLWFSKWILRWVSPWIPSAAASFARPVLKRLILGDMKETAQRNRIFEFIDDADVWKWKKSAEAAREFELFGRLGKVGREVFVLNGTGDKVHDQRNYPRIAAELPAGRFLFLPVDESLRERLFGLAAMEFARVGASDGLPPSLAGFERRVR
ncbi:MAG TPA: alpha/beta fold hydrolase [Magnetospirillaceae bacterium]|nr:alpha/beta fold hydrolase [Magnetospirillaceae bacterium]